MVSVGMATYNGEKYIGAQLDSIVQQTVLPDEIIIRDDGSSDHTLEIINDYVSAYNGIRWDVSKNKTNLGFVKNFFEVLRNCSQNIIILCDQDDIWRKDKVEKIIDFFADPKVLSLHGDINIIDKDNKTIEENRLGYKKLKEKIPVEVFFRHLYYCGMSSAFRKDLIPLILDMDPEVIPTHDWLVHAIAVCKGGFYTSSEVLSYRRFHGDNVALNLEKGERKGIQQRIDVVNYYCLHYDLLNSIYKKFGNKDKEQELVKKILRTNENRVAYLKNKSIKDAILNLVNIRYYPTLKAFISDVLYLLNIF